MERTPGQVVAGGWDSPHSHVDKPGGTTGEQNKPHNPGFQDGEIKPQKLWLKKPVGLVVVGETPSLTGEPIGEINGVSECTQTHPLGNQHLKGQNLLVGSKGSEGKWTESKAACKKHCSLSDPFPTYSATTQ